MYDIYLWRGANALPQTLSWKIESPVKAVIEEKLPDALIEKPGFLGLNLSFDTASFLLDQLNAIGARGRIADSKYRKPMISLEMAIPIAKEAMRQKQEKYPNVKFEEIRPYEDEVMWWGFFSLAKEWRDDGYIPGGLTVWVDKVDGHIWHKREFERLYGDRPPSDLKGKVERFFRRFKSFRKVRTLSGKLELIGFILRDLRERRHESQIP